MLWPCSASPGTLMVPMLMRSRLLEVSMWPVCSSLPVGLSLAV
jgi:hypothetical protein